MDDEPLEAVFLDAGGTLLEERQGRPELYADAARELGCTVRTDEVAGAMGRAHRELARVQDGHFRYSRGWFEVFIERVFHHRDGPLIELDARGRAELSRRLFERFADPATYRVRPGARELLADLAQRGLRTALISNWSEALPGLLEGLGLASRFDAILVSALEGCEKPEPEMFRRALARVGTTAQRALHAGNDARMDVQAARALGILGIGVGPREEFAALGCASVADLNALRAVLDGALRAPQGWRLALESSPIATRPRAAPRPSSRTSEP